MKDSYYVIRLFVDGELRYLLSKRYSVYFYGYARRFRSASEAERFFRQSAYAKNWHEVVRI